MPTGSYLAVRTAATLIVLPFLLACGGPSIERLATRCRNGDHEACQGLARVARDAPSGDQRREATSRLEDTALLADLARTAPDPRVRLACIERLDDQALLADILRTERVQDVRRAAVGRTTDQLVLADLASKPEPWEIHEAAASRLDRDGLDILNRRYAGIEASPRAFVREKPRCVRLVVEEDLPPGASEQLDLQATMQQLLGITLTAAPVDLVLAVSCRGEGVKATYHAVRGPAPSMTLPTGARLKVRLCLRWKDRDLDCRDASGEVQPIEYIRGRRPPTDPFRGALMLALPDVLTYVVDLRGPVAIDDLRRRTEHDDVRLALARYAARKP